MNDQDVCLESEQSGGGKLQTVKGALHNAITKVLGGWKVSLLATCFPSLAKDNEIYIEAIRANIVEVVQKALLEDFDAIIDEDTAKSLEEYSSVVKNSSGPKGIVAWRPPGDPELHMMAHDAKVLRYERQHILDSLKRAKMSSSKAQAAVEQGYKECQKNQVEIQRHLSIINELLETSEAINEGRINDLCQAVLSRSSDPRMETVSDMS